MKKILVTNDDGVYAEGIGTLARALRDAGCEVLVCAPDRERSASGHSMMMDRPLQIKRADAARTGGAEAWCCDGTPTDSVIMGLEVLKFPAEFVISGINCGPNLGDDITYSGTACAAMERMRNAHWNRLARGRRCWMVRRYSMECRFFCSG